MSLPVAFAVVGCGISAPVARHLAAGATPPRPPVASAPGTPTPARSLERSRCRSSLRLSGAATQHGQPVAHPEHLGRPGNASAHGRGHGLVGQLAGLHRHRRRRLVPDHQQVHVARPAFTVQYHEDINDNSEFFGKIQPDLQAGRSTGYDLITPSDWMVAKLIRFGYLQPLDKSLLPNWTANAQDVLKNPWYDPGNVYSVPWQAGIVGIAYNPKLTGRDITSFDDLLDPAFAGRSGLFSEMIDTMSMTLLSDGVKPEDATMDDVVAAQQKLLAAAQAGQFRAFYGNDYYDALAAGDLAVTHGLVGRHQPDAAVRQPGRQVRHPEHGRHALRRQHGHPQLRAASGRRLQADGLLVHARGGRAADRVHRLLQPGQGRPGGVLADAQAAAADGKPIKADHLTQIAHDSFPTPEELQNVYNYKQLTEDEERQWNDLFNQVVNG